MEGNYLTETSYRGTKKFSQQDVKTADATGFWCGSMTITWNVALI